MATKALNTIVEMEMADGSTVKLTLAYRWLLALSAFDRRAYDDYNAIYNKRQRDEIDNIKVLYVAYLCAALQAGEQDDAMKWDDFIDLVSTDREVVGQALTGLLAPKRKGGSETPSE